MLDRSPAARPQKRVRSLAPTVECFQKVRLLDSAAYSKIARCLDGVTKTAVAKIDLPRIDLGYTEARVGFFQHKCLVFSYEAGPTDSKEDLMLPQAGWIGAHAEV